MHREPAPTEPIREEGIEALEALGNEQRITILRALAETDTPLPFSELRRRVGIDDTGRFNYHLDQLLGPFVRQTDAGYELGYAGERLVVAVADLEPEAAAMRSDDRPTADGAGSESCPVCGEPDCDKLIHVHLNSR